MEDLDSQQQATIARELQSELTLELRSPVRIADLEYSELKLTEPTMAQLRKAAAAGAPLDQLATLIMLNTGVPMRVVDSMVKRDVEAAGDFFAQFESPTR